MSKTKFLIGGLAALAIGSAAVLYTVHNKEQDLQPIAAEKKLETLGYPSLPDVIIRNLDEFNYFYQGTGSLTSNQLINDAALNYSYYLGQVANFDYESPEYAKVNQYRLQFSEEVVNWPLLYADFASFLNTEISFIREPSLNPGYNYPNPPSTRDDKETYQQFKQDLLNALKARVKNRLDTYYSIDPESESGARSVKALYPNGKTAEEFKKEATLITDGFNQVLDTLTANDYICSQQANTQLKATCFVEYVKLITAYPIIVSASNVLKISDEDNQNYVRRVYNLNLSSDVAAFYNDYIRGLQLYIYYSK
ncbi:hypothetical protein [Psittacicella hinzii]|uniref:Uncharacterized protein n=1 Tax=Psittacicella hinzii TaxID=2028575 RepID=A0A3A1YBD2_9GAMM|nr:hypothetical protein [Psittacicella hinzii]RIY34985.1 hypothetical protein CKF58_07230 [Psittacicella hinzii]